MANTPGTKGQPIVSGAVNTAADMTAIANYAAEVGNRKVGTSSQRTALTGTDVWDGLEFYETDTGRVYRRQAGTWKSAPVLDNSDTGGAFTAVSGWSITAQTAVKVGGFLAKVYVTFTRNGGTITVPADGNLANLTLATIRNGWGPHQPDPAPLATGAGGRLAAVILDPPGGGLRLSAVAPGTSIINGDEISAGGLYLLATP